MKYTTYFHSAVAMVIFAGLSGNAISAQGEWLQPKQLIVDNSLPQAQLKTNEAVAREYASFWNTGNETWRVMPWRQVLLIKRLRKGVSRGRKALF
jgi:hypothetical protein